MDVASPSLIFSTASQPIIAAHVAAVVLTHTRAAEPSAASSEPALNPNQPNQSRPAPSMVSGTLWGRMGTRPKPARRPTMRARTRPAMPALMCTTVPPAKSIGANVALPSVEPNIVAATPWSVPPRNPPPHTMCAIGKYTIVAQIAEKTSHVENFTRSAMAPEMSATVRPAKVSWKPTNASSGMFP